MTSGLFDLNGGASAELTGVESRTLRALLQLERRHVAILAEAAGETAVTTERVSQWERSKGRGYPPALVELMRSVQLATGELASVMVGAAMREGGERLTITRPRGPGRIMTVLRLPEVAGLRFSEDQLRRLDEGGGDFWQRLCDAATVEAALSLQRDDNRPVHVALDAGDAGS